MESWREAIYIAIGLLIGVVFHEYMHARAADFFGDKTARNAGRLTLNPIPHIDPFGTVLLPLVMLLISGGQAAFGYAKPVPVNPFFMRKRRDMVFVALAGPLTNFSIAVVITLIGLVLNLIGVATTTTTFSGVFVSEVFWALYLMAFINIFLGIFNLVPIPPLDGSHLLEYFLPPPAQASYERIAPFGFVIILALFYVLQGPINAFFEPIQRLILRIMGVPIV